MFRKLVSNASFSPALVGQLSFYAKRLKKEESTRRLGLIFTALALVVQSFAVFSPPEAVNASSSSDFVRGGISSMGDFLARYDKNESNLRDMMNHIGITRKELQETKKTTANSKEGWRSYGRTSKFSHAKGETKHNYKKSNGSTGAFYSRPLSLWDTGLNVSRGSTYTVWKGTSKKAGSFVILQNCGNPATKTVPPPPPPPPPPPSPVAACSSLSAIKVNSTSYKLRAQATVKNGASISKYTFSIRDSKGKTVKSVSKTTSNTSTTTEAIKLIPGSYNAAVTVSTSVGARTSNKNCVTSFTIASPGISITKTVNDKKQEKVKLNQEFTYKIVVKNTGNTTLTNVAVTDTADDGVELVSSDQGKITGENTWTHTIPSLKASESQTVTIKAKATKHATAASKYLNNKACVDTDSIPGKPDDCDNASVEPPEETVSVCDLRTSKTVTINVSDFDSKIHSKNPDDCIKIQVCDLSSNTIISIRKTQLDTKKHSQDLNACEKIQVCELESGEVVTISRNDLDDKKHSTNVSDCQPLITNEKKAINLTGNGENATTVKAKANDRIQYTITSTNIGEVDAEATFVEELEDVLEYATVADAGGGTFDSTKKTITWPSVMLKPGESQSRLFTVQLASTIPTGARGVSERTSYDCTMLNTYGNSVEIAVDCPAVKVVETTTQELPKTGPTENLMFAGILLAVVTYFYARSRQLKSEMRLIRRDLNSGTA